MNKGKYLNILLKDISFFDITLLIIAKPFLQKKLQPQLRPSQKILYLWDSDISFKLAMFDNK